MKKIFILFILLMGQYATKAQVASYVPLKNLIAWFPFTGNALDSSGHGHNGTVHGTSMTYDRYNRPNHAFKFNGTSDHIYVPPGTPGYDQSTDITASLTISAWVKSYNYSFSPYMQIYWRGDGLSMHDPHMLYINSGDVRIRRDVDPGTTVNEVGTPVTTLDTNFHMLTGTYDSVSSIMAVYVDGVLKNSKYLPGLQTYPTSTMYNYIGAVDGGTWQFFYGTIDELGIWNRALSACEIAALYYSSKDAIIITNPPANDTVAVGGTALFTITDSMPATVYQWQEDKGSGFVDLAAVSPYSGVFTRTLTITPATMAMSGNSYRCIPSFGTCTDDISAAAKLIVKSMPTTGIDDINSASTFRIIPNPNNGEFSITGFTPDNTTVSIEITNLVGQTIYSAKADPQNREINRSVLLDNNIVNGIYFLKVHAGNNTQVLPLQLYR